VNDGTRRSGDAPQDFLPHVESVMDLAESAGIQQYGQACKVGFEAAGRNLVIELRYALSGLGGELIGIVLGIVIHHDYATL
jgi:hypothetical protein